MANDWFENLVATDELWIDDDSLWDFQELFLGAALMMINAGLNDSEKVSFTALIKGWTIGYPIHPSEVLQRRILDQMGKLGLMGKMRWYINK
jgi:hypothetical protein